MTADRAAAATGRTNGPTDGEAGVPATYGDPQRAATVEAQLLRGPGVHAADTVIDHGTHGDLVVRAASVRGTYGRYHGTPREDDYAMAASADGRWLVVALADGVTAASASHLAATLVVRTAATQATRLLEERAEAADPDLHGPPDLHGVFQSAAYQLRRAAEPLLARDGVEVSADAIAGLFATTLLLALVPTGQTATGQTATGQAATGQAADSTALLARVGDSNAWVLSGDGWQPVFAPKASADGIASAAVAALPRLPETLEVAEVALTPDQTLVLASDGVTDAFGPTLDSAVARDLARQWHPHLPAPLEFARQVSFRGQSWDDDRTAIAVRPLRRA